MRQGVCIVLILITTATWSAEGSSDFKKLQQDQVQTVMDRAAERYAEIVHPVLRTISLSYHFEALSEEKLAARALTGLYQAAKVAPPEEFARDAEKYLQELPGKSLRAKLATARKAVADVAAIRFENDVYASLRTVFAGLDPHSNYATVLFEVRRAADQRGAGIGIQLEDQPRGGSYFIRSVDFNSAAHLAGIRPGDELLEVDRTPIAPNTPTFQTQIEILQKQQRNAGVRLLVRHVNGDKALVDLARQGIGERQGIGQFLGNELVMEVPSGTATPILGFRRQSSTSWNHWLDHQHRIALIRVGLLTDGIREITQIINMLQEGGMKALVLDLRDCPSGYPLLAAELASLFLKDQSLIASCDYRDPEQLSEQAFGPQKGKYIKSGPLPSFLSFPMVVLIGPDTSGAAEMIASALQDHGRAKIVGQRSRGKASIQTTSTSGPSYNVNHSYKLTVGVFRRSSGQALHRLPGMTLHEDWGVRPDVEVVLSAQLRRQVRAWWFEHDTQPPNDLRPTALADLRNDPVLDAAVRTLLRPANAQ